VDGEAARVGARRHSPQRRASQPEAVMVRVDAEHQEREVTPAGVQALDAPEREERRRKVTRARAARKAGQLPERPVRRMGQHAGLDQKRCARQRGGDQHGAVGDGELGGQRREVRAAPGVAAGRPPPERLLGERARQQRFDIGLLAGGGRTHRGQRGRPAGPGS
jgi:hypothetical protein